MKAVDLFSGAGGFSTGARMAGVHVAWAANHWPLAVQWHEVDPDLNDDLPVDRDGQGHLVRGISLGLKEAAAEKRRSMPARVAELMRIVRAHAAADNGQTMRSGPDLSIGLEAKATCVLDVALYRFIRNQQLAADA